MKAFCLESPEVLRDHLARQREVFEPRTEGSGGVHWLPAGKNGHATPYDPSLALAQYPPKQFFFTEREALFRFEGKEFIEVLPETPPRALFGVRACDLVAISYQDKFFETDPYYQARRKQALLVGHDCAAPCEGGFCPTVDSGPLVRKDTADLVLFCRDEPEQAAWLVLVLSAAGEKALEGLSLESAPCGWQEVREQAGQRIAARFPDVPYFSKAIDALNQGKVSAELWDNMGIQCFTCSGCTSLCPTCSCFATFDRPLSAGADPAQGFERQRCWDSCLYEGFQKEAGGHNPAATPGQRLQRYWYHKFSKDFLPEFGRYGCVGCGRCENTCLGVIGVHSVMKKIAGAT